MFLDLLRLLTTNKGASDFDAVFHLNAKYTDTKTASDWDSSTSMSSHININISTMSEHSSETMCFAYKSTLPDGFIAKSYQLTFKWFRGNLLNNSLF